MYIFVNSIPIEILRAKTEADPGPKRNADFSSDLGGYKESWLTNSALVYEPRCGGRGELRPAGSQSMSTAVEYKWSPNKLWTSDSIFNLCSDPIDS